MIIIDISGGQYNMEKFEYKKKILKWNHQKVGLEEMFSLMLF